MAYPKDAETLQQELAELENDLATVESSDGPYAEEGRGATYQLMGELLMRLGRYEEAGERFAQSAETLRSAGSLLTLIVQARLQQAECYRNLGREREALAVVTDLLSEVDHGTPTPEQPGILALAERLRLGLVGMVDGPIRAGELAAEITTRYGIAELPTERELLAFAFQVRGLAALSTDDIEVASAMFRQADSFDLQGRLAQRTCDALFEWAVAMEKDARRDDALRAYESVVERCSSVTEPWGSELSMKAQQRLKKLRSPRRWLR